MKKLSLFLILIAASWTAVISQNDSKQNTEKEKISTIAVDDFQSKAENLVDKEIFITGTVDHVCKHGGKRLQLIGSKEDARLKIEAGENISKFNKEIEGDEIQVHGLVKELRIDEAYLNDWEAEVKDHHKPEDQEYKDDMKRIKNMREQVKNSEKGYLSFYSLDAIDFKVLK